MFFSLEDENQENQVCPSLFVCMYIMSVQYECECELAIRVCVCVCVCGGGSDAGSIIATEGKLCTPFM